MKLLATATAFAVARGQSTPKTGNWKINCQTTTSLEDEPGPAYTAARTNSDGSTDIYWAAYGKGYGGVSASGDYQNNASGSFCDTHDNSSITALTQPDIFGNPNMIANVPTEIFGNGFFSVADGFASINTYDGCIAIVNSNGNIPAGAGDMQFLTQGCNQGNILQDKYYYHYTQWFDMDADGDLDLVTARSGSRNNPDNVTTSAMVWYQNPGKAFSPTAKAWKSYVLDNTVNVVDSSFNVMMYNNLIYGVAGGFSSGKLVLLSGDNWAATSNVAVQVIQSDTPYYFDTFFRDINLDGIPDVIVTIGSYGLGNGRLLIYPGVDTNGIYSLEAPVTVYDQFPVFNSGDLASPGGAYVFWYSQADQANGVIPSILISGDDDGYMYIADPDKNDVADFDWTFDTNVIYKTKSFNPFVTPFTAPTVGQPTLTDINGDGCIDIVVAAYSQQQLVFLEQKSTRNCMP